ncbi:hypothetical protein ACIBG7_21235 [Nonomuraea sp. NPDC050328]|uniref:hypothetical protein n=1 Tax=Nonomuraea sp. NPDC050328 TaxID=3364361 RepID=UPI00379E9E4A
MGGSTRRRWLALAAGAGILLMAAPGANASAGAVAGAAAAKPGAAVSTFNDPSCWKNVVNDVKSAASKVGLQEWWRSKYTFAAGNGQAEVFVTFHPYGETSQLGFRPTAYGIFAAAGDSATARHYRDQVKAKILAITYFDYC